MEPAAAFCEFQLANWSTTEEPAAEVWAPGGLAVGYASIIDIFGSCSLQPYVVPSSSSGGQQLVEYNYYAAATGTGHDDPTEKAAQESFEVDLHNMKMEIYNKDPIRVFEEVAHSYEADVDMMEVKMHRYPPVIRALDDWYTVPRVVAIGPYHHGRHHLKESEKVKHVAAYHCIMESGRSVQEIYDAVVSVADDARCLYHKDEMAGIGEDDFRHMMFFDACFLVQFMLRVIGARINPKLHGFFGPNDNDLFHDVFLLENQLPWLVVETIMSFRQVPLKAFISCVRGCLQDRKEDPQEQPVELDESYKPPHLLGLLRYYVVGRSSTKLPRLKTNSISVSVSAMELAEIGITLTAYTSTTELIHMGVKKRGSGGLFPDLSLAPLSLDRSRASCIVNMAALELRSVLSFGAADDEDTAVCSYLCLLAMLVYSEEDVQELRARGLLQGGGGLTNKEALRFFTSLQGFRLGSRYARIMQEIEIYKVSRQTQTKVHAFYHKHKKAIITYITAIGGVVGIFGTLVGILTRLKSFKGAP